MPGQRTAGARRARGSTAPRIAGAGVVLMLAGIGVVASLVAGRTHVTPHHIALPGKVQAVQEVGLLNAGPPAPAGGTAAPAQTLMKLPSGLAFAPPRQAGPQWTADQMAGGTFIFIYIQDGMCLSSAADRPAADSRAADSRAADSRAGRRRIAVVLRRCNLGAAQRWQRQDADARGYWRLRNAADRRCLTLASASPAGGQGAFSADLSPCGIQQDWRQRVTFSPNY
jgi:Ricin-type beta-trefoil lectin domain-like